MRRENRCISRQPPYPDFVAIRTRKVTTWSRLAAVLGLAAALAGAQETALNAVLDRAARGDVEAMFQAGLAYHEGNGVRQDFSRALEFYLKAARAGHSPSQARLAKLYQLGLGAGRDQRLALFWYQHAAGQGQRDAQYELGLIYFSGDGVERDAVQALQWASLAARAGHAEAADLETSIAAAASKDESSKAAKLVADFKPQPARAIRPEEEPSEALRAMEEERFVRSLAEVRQRADAGDPKAQVVLGRMLHWGNGVEQDEPASVRWFRKAAEAGDADGQFCLGVAYFEGHGVERDILQAYRWTLIAASQGHKQANVNLGYVLMAITNEELAKARELAAPDVAKWTEAAARAWNPTAQFNLARLFLAGYAKPVDVVQAYKWLLIASGEGNEAAIKLLAALKEQVPPETEKEARTLARQETHRHIRERAAQGEANAQVLLGRMYEEGVIERQDPSAAWAWYSLAAAQGDEAARQRQAELEPKLTPDARARAAELLRDLRARLQTAPPLP